jgi:uncharacterized protein (TIGR03435 family)
MNWQSQTLALLSASLLRPLMLAAAAWLILRVFKVRHPASRHAVWSAVLIGMLLLPAVSVIAPHWKLPLLPRRENSPTQTPLLTSDASPYVFSGFVSGGNPSVNNSPASPVKVVEWPAPATILLWCYLVGVLAMAGYRVIGWIMLVRVMSRSKTLRRRLRESSDLLIPVTVGVLRPSVILPTGWPAWNTTTKRAVFAHEFAHIRRGDTWISFLTRLAKCVYWFHPLAWWISRQIADLAEFSCDAAVLEKNTDPGGYSRILLGFAETVNAAGGRASLPGVAIASRSRIGPRIDQVFELAGGNLRRLSRPKTVIALMGFPVICIAATVGLTTPSPRRAADPVAIAQLQRPAAAASKIAQPQPAPKPTFDVVSVKRCPPAGLPGPASGEGGGRGTGPQYSPGRLRMQCMTVGAMMQAAYLGLFGDGEGLLNYTPSMGSDKWFKKAPGWVTSELYTVEGKTDDPAAKVANGRGRSSGDKVLERMLQVALEDRFQLKLHQETEDVPMYNLTIAAGGLRLKPMAPGGCIEPDPSKGVPAPNGVFLTGEMSPDGKTPPCMIVLHTKGPDWVLDAAGQRPGNLVAMLSKALDRHVFDKTGTTDQYTFHLQFAHDESAPGDLPPAMIERMFPRTDVPSGPSIFTVLDRQGLKLEPTKGPQGRYVIDHIERPSEN